MSPTFLQPEIVAREDGAGPVVDLAASQDRTLILTLGITRALEQESLDISVWASQDGENWGTRPLVTFPQKFYCGTYSLATDAAAESGARFLQARWKMSRWGRGRPTALFGFYLALETSEERMMVAGR